MRLRHVLLLTAAAFAGGVTFVIACGDHLPGVDAALPDAQVACSTCEKPITADRIYLVKQRASGGSIGASLQTVRISAQCQEGDRLLGGGCWIYGPSDGLSYQVYDSRHPLLAQGPVPTPPRGSPPDKDNLFQCVFDNSAHHDEDMIAIATAICFHPEL